MPTEVESPVYARLPLPQPPRPFAPYADGSYLPYEDWSSCPLPNDRWAALMKQYLIEAWRLCVSG